MLEFRLLGPVEVSDGGRPIPLRHRERALVACLALRVRETVSVDALVEALWGQAPPRTAGAALHNAVSQVRKELGADVVRTRPPGYALDVDPVRVDVHRFAALVGAARAATEASQRAEALRSALVLWRGRPLADLVAEPFAALESSRLEEAWLAVREDLVEAELALGRHAAVLADAEALVAEQPFSERARGLLMIALYRAGRQADALEAYQDTRRFLRDELGLEPSSALRRLQAAILRQDPALDPPDVEPALPVGEERRKTVSVVFSDLVDSTGLAAELDPEAYRAVIRRWYRAARSVLEAHGATVEKFVGDAVVGVFGIPTQREDDALRAVRAAVELGDRLVALNAELESVHGVRVAIRTGVNTGEAIAGELGAPGSFATGYAVNVAAKLQQSAPEGGILIGPATFALVRDAVRAEEREPVLLGRRGTTLTPYRVHALDRRAPGLARRLDTPLVGRREELAALRAAFAGAVAEGKARVVTVVGEAGVGKSRLAAELAASVRDQATVIVGRCVSYGEGATYLPLAEVVGQLAGGRSEGRIATLVRGADDARLVARRVRELLGWAPEAPPPGEGPWAVRRLLEAQASARPLLVVLDDVHWAEPTLLELVVQLGEQVGDAPLVVLCLARPGLVERRADWPVTLELGPLPDETAAQLVERYAGAAAVSEQTRRRIVGVAGGNALFVEQLLAHVLQAGEQALERTPASLDALLAARLELLPEEERSVLERAAVVGREFWSGALEALSERDVARELEALAAKGLVHPAESPLAGEPAYRFHHVLIRDVAYGSATKERRAALHERVAAWLDEHQPAWDEVTGYHLEQAHRYRLELGRRDKATERLAHAAGDRLADAGIGAWKRLDARAAESLLGRAGDLLPTGSRRAGVLIERARALTSAGEHARVVAALAEARDVARAAASRPHELWAEIEAEQIRLAVGDARDVDAHVGRLATALAVFEECGDDRMLGRGWFLVGAAHAMRLHNEAAADAAERAAWHYRRAGWPPAAAIISAAAAVLHGPVEARAAAAQLDALAASADDRSSRAGVLVARAVLEAMQGGFSVAEECLREARELWEALRFPFVRAAFWDSCAAEVARLQRDSSSRVAILQASCDELAEMGQDAYVGTRAAEVGHALLDRRDAEAARFARLADQHVPAYDVFGRVLVMSLRARLAACESRLPEGERAGRQAVELAETTDAPGVRAHAALALAEVLRAGGDDAGAGEQTERALRLYEGKGNGVDAARVRDLLADASVVER